jgi:hypothetical protein
MKFDEIFEEFMTYARDLKVIHVATCGKNGVPNSAPKMLVEIAKPNRVIFLDYKFQRTYANVTQTGRASVSIMNDPAFKGFRLTGSCRVLEKGKDFEAAKQTWEKKVIGYEAERLIERLRGGYSSKHSEIMLPTDFVMVLLTAEEASAVHPERVLRAIQEGNG